MSMITLIQKTVVETKHSTWVKHDAIALNMKHLKSLAQYFTKSMNIPMTWDKLIGGSVLGLKIFYDPNVKKPYMIPEVPGPEQSPDLKIYYLRGRK